jgi:hypothetical protein
MKTKEENKKKEIENAKKIERVEIRSDIELTIRNNYSQHLATAKMQVTEYYINTLEKFTLPKNVLGKKAIAKGRFVKDEENEISFEASGIIVE